jgi:Ser-tRNA(Ala) deacylase AlaX
MTRKLYWEDPYTKEFDARVVSVDENKVVLDQTAFYPRGGGQVGDTGEISDIRVLDTIKEDERIVHVLESKPNFSLGSSVHGKIDWERRHKIMRLHSAAHIVYYFMKEVYPGAEIASSGIVDDKKVREDYLIEPFYRENLKLVENKANEFIQQGKDIKTWVDENGRRHWLVEGLPEMFCAGTHVKNTKEIGRISVRRGSKPGKGKERIEISLISYGS